MTTAITLSFVALAALTLFALLASRWPGWLKGLLVLGVTVFYFYAEEAVHAAWGWPSGDALPERFVMLSAVIEEPTSRTAGALYLWVTTIENGKPAAQPRAYRLAYSKDLHVMLNEGVKKSRQGVTQLGTTTPKQASKPSFGWMRPGSDDQLIKITDLPVPQLPEK